ncbi:RNA dependent RNA polymerase-domain-containing protein [Boletus reticuloceps]|uniref:RNA-dependent RNA polymerase n=1 Tax=Boletus reticuloceps TaxID=495285 RepID=A0A8I2YF97_9AGAM|nr:RNA dependent RNA polymerase-domain-containing protein [Boletus reticuloceps]
MHPGDGNIPLPSCTIRWLMSIYSTTRIRHWTPPKDRVYLFGHLKNVVVFPTTGKFDLVQHPIFRMMTFAKGTWSLPNGLAGGDLDGDTYAVIQYGDLLVPEHDDPGSYPPVEPFKLDRPSTIGDVCDFIVEYINSDVVV